MSVLYRNARHKTCFVCYVQCGGIDCVCDILCDGGRSTGDVTRMSERVRSEAAGVIAQLTSPALVISPQVHNIRHTSLISNLADLVPALTGTVHPSPLVVSVSV